jgi:riboflavin biosynthesis pyrimidine reductase
MRIDNDYPEVFAVDSQNSTDLKQWWDTLGPQWVRVNLVSDTLGNTVGATGSSSDLTGGGDRAALNALRELADVVLIGGATVRAEPDSVPRTGDVVIVSRSGDVPLAAIKRARGTITVLHAQSGSAPRATTGVVLARFTGAAIIAAVRKLGYTRIVCDGGLTLIGKLLDANVIDEWCQTLSPKLGVRTPGLTVPDVGGTLSNVAHDADGYRYTRRRLGGAPQKRSSSPTLD